MNIGSCGMSGLGCAECPSKKRCSVTNRLNGHTGPSFREDGMGEEGGEGLFPTIERGVDKALDYKKAQYAAEIEKAKAAQARAMARSARAQAPSSFNLNEWVNPFYGGTLNVKAVVVLGGLGYLAWRAMRRKER